MKKLDNHRFTPTENFIVFNNPIERWVQMNDILDGNYFISSEGRVSKLTHQGIFTEVKSYFDSTDLKVPLYGKSNTKQSKYRVSRLVMTYFVGGYYNRRIIGFKNDNRHDCSLRNLYWFSGFTNHIDYNYLKTLKHSTLSDRDIQVVNYLLTKDVKYLFNLVNDCAHLLRKVVSNKQGFFNISENISTIVLDLSDVLLSGKYKPLSNRIKYKTQCVFSVLSNIVLTNAFSDTNTTYTDNNYFLNKSFQQTL